jgi:hypothetical protein
MDELQVQTVGVTREADYTTILFQIRAQDSRATLFQSRGWQPRRSELLGNEWWDDRICENEKIVRTRE